LKRLGCDVALLISPKEVDQQAVKSVSDMDIVTLPAVGLQNRNYLTFARSFWNSFRATRRIFRGRPPAAVLAMGGFTSAPPVLGARKFRAKTFLHESNTIPGKANRLLAGFVDEVFVGFPEAAARLRAKKISVTGTPVRPQFFKSATGDPKSAIALGLDPNLPVVLVVGGSQGARGLNDLVLSALPFLARKNWQWLHFSGVGDFEKVQSAYDGLGIKAVVKPFFAEMDLALDAATACVSRAGASSLAEIAAMGLPSALVPLPTAADNHQYHNALAFEKTDAGLLLDQNNSAPEKVAAVLTELVCDESIRSSMQAALARWHTPDAAAQIAGNILAKLSVDSFNQPKSAPVGGTTQEIVA
jgi:UDP-N-acetylglucosamine--N-acetylmuramyl-(pentapeptide) pyrophosphoryl-undecaprenol N-acetylglucosamine transferase